MPRHIRHPLLWAITLIYLAWMLGVGFWSTPEQAARVAWRIAKDWLEAQAALIDAEMALLDEVMLPYMLGDRGQTVYDIFRTQAMKEIER